MYQWIKPRHVAFAFFVEQARWLEGGECRRGLEGHRRVVARHGASTRTPPRSFVEGSRSPDGSAALPSQGTFSRSHRMRHAPCAPYIVTHNHTSRLLCRGNHVLLSISASTLSEDLFDDDDDDSQPLGSDDVVNTIAIAICTSLTDCKGCN